MKKPNQMNKKGQINQCKKTLLLRCCIFSTLGLVLSVLVPWAIYGSMYL